MPELLRLRTDEFLFTIKAASIENQSRTLSKTLLTRHGGDSNVFVRVEPAIRLSEPPRGFIDGSCSFLHAVDDPNHCDQVNLDFPIFFENTSYQIEWLFLQRVQGARINHRSKTVCDSFIFTPSEDSFSAKLSGTINTGNDVGWLRLPLTFELDGKTHTQHIAFEVLPTKMALHQDLPAMYQDIDKIYPLWRFSLVEKTEQDSAETKQRHQFPLLWLANFSHLRNKLTHALKVISQAPHSRLQSHTSYNKAARLKGKIPARLGAKIKEDFANGLYEQRYQVTKKQLSVDTPENRFIRMVVATSKKRLADFEYKLRQSNAAPDKQQLSDAFLDELHQWQQPLQKTLKQGFMNDVGDYNGRNRESLVLQQKVGYSSVYRIWQELRFYLDVFDNQSSISIKSVEEIYEVWCFLRLKQILEQDLGFDAIKKVDPKLSKGVLGELKLKKGDRGSFDFFRKSDSIKATLYHEKEYRRATKEIRSFLLTHRPDIILEVKLPSGQEFIWLFDAKYRISDIKTDRENQYIGNPTEDERNLWLDKTKEDKKNSTFFIKDGVPDDAINQMHRYRDALIRIDKNKINNTNYDCKSRPVCGAFALYPGHFNQINEDNPYLNAINEINIGAFALLPSIVQESSKSDNGYRWLLDFLRQNIGNSIPINESGKEIYQRNSTVVENIYLQEAARIPYDGMRQVLYKDLTLVLAINENDINYPHIKINTSTEYALNKNSFSSRYDYHILKEVHYLGLALSPDNVFGNYQVHYVWPVENIIIKPENFTFILGKPLKLQDIVHDVPNSIESSFRLTTLSYLQEADNFNTLKEVY